MVSLYQPIPERITKWLHDEHKYQFDKNQVTHSADPQRSMDYIVNTELMNKWHRFRLFSGHVALFEDSGMVLQADQQLLKVCAAARAALVWQYVLKGSASEEANTQTWRDLTIFNNAVEVGSETIPDDILLNTPLAQAIAPLELTTSGSLRPLFTRFVALTISQLHKQVSQTGQLIIPQPGLPSGDILPWKSE